MTLINQLIIGWVAIFLLINLTFLIGIKLNNFCIIDVLWGLSFGILATIFLCTGDGYFTRKLILAILAITWAIRLGVYLLLRIRKKYPEEDKRYKFLLNKWGDRKYLYMYIFYHIQGLLIVILSPVFAVPTLEESSQFSIVEYIGIFIITTSIICESISDYQLFMHKNSISTDNVYRKGFWKYSRHPNYFFQWLAWVGFFIFSLNSSGLFTIYCPLLMLFLLTKVTGINNNEAHNITSKGKEYLIYQKTTSCFIPLPPRKYKY